MRFPTFYPDQITINDNNDKRLRYRIHVFYIFRGPDPGAEISNLKVTCLRIRSLRFVI
jgi:hypothetical protein